LTHLVSYLQIQHILVNELTNMTPKSITHAESWESQLSNGIRVGGSRTESYEQNIHPRAVVEIMISTEFLCDLKTRHLLQNNESPNNSYVILFGTKNYISTWRAVICWSFYRDIMWFVGPILKYFMLSRNVSYIDSHTTWEHLNDFWSKQKFQRHE
jgi:hypothetical protein